MSPSEEMVAMALRIGARIKFKHPPYFECSYGTIVGIEGGLFGVYKILLDSGLSLCVFVDELEFL